MKATQSRQNPAEWEESAPLLPKTARDLPAGRHQFHKERLMAHIQQDTQRDASTTKAAPARPKSRGFRLLRPAFALPAMALAGAAVAGTLLIDDGAHGSGVATGPAAVVPVGATTTKGLPQLIDQVSLAAAEETHPTVGPGQYVYIESQTSDTFVKTVGDDSSLASYALHHIRTPRAKLAFYRRCYRALRRGGVLINGDCAPASTPRGFARDLDVWFAHLSKTFGSRARGRRIYESWSDEDVYVPLADEIRLLERAGFAVDVPWRRSPFAVIVSVRDRA